MASYWIFNCNPKKYDLPGLIASGEIKVGRKDWWRANQHKGDMSIGDQILHWVTGKESGIYAQSEIVGNLRQGEDEQWVVDIVYKAIYQPHLPKEKIADHPELKELRIIKSPRQSNYPISDSDFIQLNSLTKTLWTPSELANILRIPLTEPKFLTKKAWEEEIAPVTRSFLIDIDRVLQDFEHHRVETKVDVKKARQCWDNAKFSAQNHTLHIFIGQDDKNDKYSDQLFWGFYHWGSEGQVNKYKTEFINRNLLLEDMSVASIEGKAFSGSAFLAGRFLGPDEIEKMDSLDLVKQIAADLTDWREMVMTLDSGIVELINDLYLKSKLDEDWWLDWYERLGEREQRIPVIRNHLEDLRSGSITFEDFRRQMDEEGRAHNRWGFNGISGQMFLNMLVNTAADVGEGTDVLAAFLEATSAPKDITEAANKLEVFTQAVSELKEESGKRNLNPSYSRYLLSFFWQIEHPQAWMVYWPNSTRPFLIEMGLFEETREYGQNYFRYHHAVMDVLEQIKSSEEWNDSAEKWRLWETEGLTYWWKNVYSPPGPSPQDDMGLISHVEAFFLSKGFSFPRDIIASYVISLQSKPFVILSGISGTGKTKLAQLFADFISPNVEIEIEQYSDLIYSDEVLSIIVKPYMQEYSRMIVPIDNWDFFPNLPIGEETRITIEANNKREECLLKHRYHGASPNGIIQLLFKGAVSVWIRDELEVGEVFEFTKISDTKKDIYKLQKSSLSPTVRVKKSRNYIAFVPVRPDWTDSRGLLGFYHLLTGAFHGTDFLRTILQAHADTEKRPYFVVLDEMNLARVEHYFSDFLSVLESTIYQPLDIEQDKSAGHDDFVITQAFVSLHDQPRCVVMTGFEQLAEGYFDTESESKECNVKCTNCPFSPFIASEHYLKGINVFDQAKDAGFEPTYFAPPRFAIPRNIYFSGTVNIDETTYSFSPKVLDRANVIVFDEVSLSSYFSEADPINTNASSASQEQVELFTHEFHYPFVSLGRSASVRGSSDLRRYRMELISLVELLRPYRMHFGYRVADELLTFLENTRLLNDKFFSLDDAMDRSIAQKILPKLTGARARLRTPLLSLLAFCTIAGEFQDDDTPGVVVNRVVGLVRQWESQPINAIQENALTDLRYQITGQKLLWMLHDLEEDGFTSLS